MKILEIVAILLVLITAAFTAYFTLDARHAHQEALLEQEREHDEKILRLEKELLATKLELREDFVTDSLKQDAAAAAHYRNIERDPDLELTRPEQSRQDFVERQVETKQRELEILQLKQMDLEEK